MADGTPTNRIMVLHTGGLGDLVLAAELIGGIRKALPGAHLSLVCKAAFAGIAGLYPDAPDEVVALEFNPAAWDAPSPALFDALRPVVDDLRARPRADVFIEATFHPSWFGWVAAGAMQPGKACCCTAIDKPEFLVSNVMETLALEPCEVENLTLPGESHELDRYRLILKWLGIEPQVVFPWTRAASAAGDYLVCFPGGSASAEVKRWPVGNFSRVLRHVREKWNLPVVLIGEKRELEALEQLAADTGDVRIVTGGRDDIPKIAGLLGNARAYLGNDTGPLHIASAYGVPGVVIYGGGHWPAYAPWGEGSVGLLHPLPCFGCDWDCVFGHGLCVEAIEPALVEEALDGVLAKPGGRARVQTVRRVSPETEQVIALASPRYRAVQRDRGDRWVCMMEQNASLEKAETSMQEAFREAGKREAGLHELDAMIGQRDARIAELELASAERLKALQEIDESYRDLSQEAERRLADIEKLTAWLRERDARIAELEQTAAERLQVLQGADAARAEITREAERRLADVEQLTAWVGERDARIADLERTAAERLEVLQAADAARVEITREAEQRLADVLQLTEWLRERDARIAELEQAAAERVTP